MSGHSDAMLEAIVAALDAEAVEADLAKRMLMLEKIRTTLQAWREARVTAEEAIDTLVGVQQREVDEHAREPTEEGKKKYRHQRG